MPVDVHISPEQLVTDYIQRLIESSGRSRCSTSPTQGSPRRGAGLPRRSPGRPCAAGASLPHADHRYPGHGDIQAGGAIVPEGSTVIEADDEVFFVAAAQHIGAVMGELRRRDKAVRRVLLAGGGNIGRRLANALERNYHVKLIESDLDRARHLSEFLDHTIVLNGDATDEDLLLEENIDSTDVFCAVTNDDQSNILSAMLAKQMGARKVMALINRGAYVDLVQNGLIDIAISPQQATISGLLAHVRRGDVVAVHSLRRGAAEAIEAVAHGDRRTSRVVGRSVEELKLPPGTTIDAVVRGEEVIIAHHDTVIEAGDHVILFLIDKTRIAEVERLFQVGITFL